MRKRKHDLVEKGSSSHENDKEGEWEGPLSNLIDSKSIFHHILQSPSESVVSTASEMIQQLFHISLSPREGEKMNTPQPSATQAPLARSPDEDEDEVDISFPEGDGQEEEEEEEEEGEGEDEARSLELEEELAADFVSDARDTFELGKDGKSDETSEFLEDIALLYSSSLILGGEKKKARQPNEIPFLAMKQLRESLVEGDPKLKSLCTSAKTGDCVFSKLAKSNGHPFLGHKSQSDGNDGITGRPLFHDGMCLCCFLLYTCTRFYRISKYNFGNEVINPFKVKISTAGEFCEEDVLVGPLLDGAFPNFRASDFLPGWLDVKTGSIFPFPADIFMLTVASPGGHSWMYGDRVYTLEALLQAYRKGEVRAALVPIWQNFHNGSRVSIPRLLRPVSWRLELIKPQANLLPAFQGMDLSFIRQVAGSENLWFLWTWPEVLEYVRSHQFPISSMQSENWIVINCVLLCPMIVPSRLWRRASNGWNLFRGDPKLRDAEESYRTVFVYSSNLQMEMERDGLLGYSLAFPHHPKPLGNIAVTSRYSIYWACIGACNLILHFMLRFSSSGSILRDRLLWALDRYSSLLHLLSSLGGCPTDDEVTGSPSYQNGDCNPDHPHKMASAPLFVVPGDNVKSSLSIYNVSLRNSPVQDRVPADQRTRVTFEGEIVDGCDVSQLELIEGWLSDHREMGEVPASCQVTSWRLCLLPLVDAVSKKPASKITSAEFRLLSPLTIYKSGLFWARESLPDRNTEFEGSLLLILGRFDLLCCRKSLVEGRLSSLRASIFGKKPLGKDRLSAFCHVDLYYSQVFFAIFSYLRATKGYAILGAPGQTVVDTVHDFGYQLYFWKCLLGLALTGRLLLQTPVKYSLDSGSLLLLHQQVSMISAENMDPNLAKLLTVCFVPFYCCQLLAGDRPQLRELVRRVWPSCVIVMEGVIVPFLGLIPGIVAELLSVGAERQNFLARFGERSIAVLESLINTKRAGCQDRFNLSRHPENFMEGFLASIMKVVDLPGSKEMVEGKISKMMPVQMQHAAENLYSVYNCALEKMSEEISSEDCAPDCISALALIGLLDVTGLADATIILEILRLHLHDVRYNIFSRHRLGVGSSLNAGLKDRPGSVFRGVVFRMLLEKIQNALWSYEVRIADPFVIEAQKGIYYSRGLAGLIPTIMASIPGDIRNGGILFSRDVPRIWSLGPANKGSKSVNFDPITQKFTADKPNQQGKPSQSRFSKQTRSVLVDVVPTVGVLRSFFATDDTSSSMNFKGFHDERSTTIREELSNLTRQKRMEKIVRVLGKENDKVSETSQVHSISKGLGMLIPGLQCQEKRIGDPVGKASSASNQGASSSEERVKGEKQKTKTGKIREHIDSMLVLSGLPECYRVKIQRYFKGVGCLVNCTECGNASEYSSDSLGPWSGIWCRQCVVPWSIYHTHRCCSECGNLCEKKTDHSQKHGVHVEGEDSTIFRDWFSFGKKRKNSKGRKSHAVYISVKDTIEEFFFLPSLTSETWELLVFCDHCYTFAGISTRLRNLKENENWITSEIVENCLAQSHFHNFFFE